MKTHRFRKAKAGLKVIGRTSKFAVLAGILAIAIGAYYALHTLGTLTVYPLKHLSFGGNKHLTDDELRSIAGVHLGESLIVLSNKNISRELLKSPWINAVTVRKEFPDTISVTIQETEPFALLELSDHLFLVDEQGKILEELQGNSVPFLPVVTGDPAKESRGFAEALKLVRAMNVKGFTAEREQIEIVAHNPHELSAKLDGTVVKIGEGRYEEKLDRLVRLEEDLQKMGIPVDYIDIRFENRSVVKPVSDKVVP
jgi:cell division protein FtsQ